MCTPMNDDADNREAGAELLTLLAAAYGVRNGFDAISKQVARRALGHRPGYFEGFAVALILSSLAGEPGVVERLRHGLGHVPDFREVLLARLYFLKPPAARAALIDQVVAEVISALKVT